jgi:hypothetical protein
MKRSWSVFQVGGRPAQEGWWRDTTWWLLVRCFEMGKGEGGWENRDRLSGPVGRLYVVMAVGDVEVALR